MTWKSIEGTAAIIIAVVLLLFLHLSDALRMELPDYYYADNFESISGSDSSGTDVRWMPTEKGKVRFGPDGVVWLRLKGELFPSALEQEGVVTLNRTNLDTIEFRHSVNGVTVKEILCGRGFDHSSHAMITPFPAFPVFATSGTHEVVMRIVARPGIEAVASYGSAAEMFERSVRISSRRSAFLGGQLLVALVAVVIALVTRINRGSYLALFAVCSVGIDLLINGFSFPVLWPGREGLAILLPVFGTLLIFSQIRLVYFFFRLPDQFPKLARVVDYGFVLPTLLFLVVTVAQPDQMLWIGLKIAHLVLWFVFLVWLMVYTKKFRHRLWPWLLIFLPFNVVFILEMAVFMGFINLDTGIGFEASAFLMTVGLALLITTRQQTLHAEAEKQRQWLNLVFHSIGDGIIVLDTERRVVRVNGLIEKLFQQSSSDLVGKKLLHLRPWEEKAVLHFRREYDAVIQSKKPGNFFSIQVVLPDEINPRFFSINFSPLLSPQGEVREVVLLLRDLTDRALLEERLNHTERMESMGRLVSGVAHDFNNTLSGIAGLAELLLQYKDDPVQTEKLGQSIVDAAEVSRGLATSLLSFSRPRPRQMEPIDLHKIIEDALSLARLTSLLGITVQRRFGASESASIGDASALQDALLNLIINAKDAMPDGGEIVIETRNLSLTSEQCAMSGFKLRPGMFIEASISDTGGGVPSHHLNRIFEPFFSTKPHEKGTGLGLSTAYSTVVAHNGSISAESVVGIGTRFVIRLPV